ncbi:MAG: adenylate/guanylate cyclase domain-containing protein, partial [Proteobacteria bacterium]|nr:adenylate/guanylate cyclase domain-containing protein [Pseudomonadota bacterium]
MTADARARAMGDLREWIVKQGLDATEFGAFLEMLCHRLVGAGLPLLRVNISMRAQHPEVGGFAH